MNARFIYLSMVVILNIASVSGQAILYDYDSNGNRTRKSIVLNKSANINANTEVKYLTAEYKETLEELIVKIYPNPTKEYLFVELFGMKPDRDVNYRISSQTGTILETKRKVGTTFIIDFNKYKEGIYFLILNIGNEVSRWKIVKE